MRKEGAFKAGYNTFLAGMTKRALAVNPYMYSPATQQFARNPWSDPNSLANQFSTFSNGLPTFGPAAENPEITEGKPAPLTTPVHIPGKNPGVRMNTGMSWNEKGKPEYKYDPSKDMWAAWRNHPANQWLQNHNNQARYDWLRQHIDQLPATQRADALRTITDMPVDLKGGKPVQGGLYSSPVLPGPEAFDSRSALSWAYDQDTKNGVGFERKYNTEGDMFDETGLLRDGIPAWEVAGGGQDGGKFFNPNVAGGRRFTSPLEYAQAWERENWANQRNAQSDDQKFQTKFNEITGINDLPAKYRPVGQPNTAGYIGERDAATRYDGSLESAQAREKWFTDNYENVVRTNDALGRGSKLSPKEYQAERDKLEATRAEQQKALGIQQGQSADAFANSDVAKKRYGGDVDAAKSDYWASKGIKWTPADTHFQAHGAMPKPDPLASMTLWNTGRTVGPGPDYKVADTPASSPSVEKRDRRYNGRYYT